MSASERKIAEMEQFIRQMQARSYADQIMLLILAQRLGGEAVITEPDIEAARAAKLVVMTSVRQGGTKEDGSRLPNESVVRVMTEDQAKAEIEELKAKAPRIITPGGPAIAPARLQVVPRNGA